MTTSHTPGRLYVVESDEHWGRVNCHITAEHDDAMLGSIWCGSSAQNRADAHRLVACWNALEMLSTGKIEAVAAMGGFPGAVGELLEQRDALLEVLKEVASLDFKELYVNDDVWRVNDVARKARKAIAKAEGEV